MFRKLLKKSLILISLIFTSCGNFFAPDINEKVRGYFEYYTDNAAVEKYDLDGSYPENSASKVTVNAATKIHDCNGRGISIYGSDSTLILNSGEIYNCNKSGLYITSRGKVICPNDSTVNIYNNKLDNIPVIVRFHTKGTNKAGYYLNQVHLYINQHRK